MDKNDKNNSIAQLLKFGYQFHKGGGDDSHGIRYGFTIRLFCNAEGQYEYTFVEYENDVQITDRKSIVKEDDLEIFLWRTHQIDETELRSMLIKY